MSSGIESLRENNPFYSSSHPDPWVRQFPNITSINGEVFSSIVRIINKKQNQSSNPVGLLIKGESGSGKTHMIARIREYCEKTNFEIKFATIKPIIDYQTPLRRVLKGIITNLAHPVSDQCRYTQIHGLVFSIICDYYAHRPENKSMVKNLGSDVNKFFDHVYRKQEDVETLLKGVQGWTIKEIPTINPLFVRLLFSFCNPELQHIAHMRLIGEIGDPEEAQLLHLPFQESSSDPAMEEEAREFLISLGLLLSRYNQSLIVCFDQLENLKNKELVEAFGQIIFTIINDCRSIIPLTFMRTLFWEEVFSPALDQSISERLAMNQWILRGCNDDEVEEIIRTRIQEILPDNWSEPYSWLIKKVKETINKNPSPREVIRCANTIIIQSDSSSVHIPKVTPEEVIHAAYTNERELIISDLDSWPPDYEELSEAIITYLTSRKYQISRKKLARKSILTVSKNNSTCCIIVNTNRNHSAIGSSFGKGTEFLQKNPGATCIYLTDPRCLITKESWNQANVKKDNFIRAGGIILQPSTSEIARFYALYSISCKICEQDILIDTASGIRPLTQEELIEYLKEPVTFKPLIHRIPEEIPETAKRTYYQDDHIRQALCRILTQKSMHIMGAEALSGQLSSQGITMSHDDLIIWCGRHSDTFRIIQSQQGSMIILHGKDHVC